MSKRRVVVTGLGMLTPVGNDVDSTWLNIKNGVSGIAPITTFDTSAYKPVFVERLKTSILVNILRQKMPGKWISLSSMH